MCLFVRKVRVIYSCLWKQRIRILVFWLEWALIKRFPYSFRIRKSVLWGLYAFPKHIDFPGRTAKPQESNRPALILLNGEWPSSAADVKLCRLLESLPLSLSTLPCVPLIKLLHLSKLFPHVKDSNTSQDCWENSYQLMILKYQQSSWHWWVVDSYCWELSSSAEWMSFDVM